MPVVRREVIVLFFSEKCGEIAFPFLVLVLQYRTFRMFISLYAKCLLQDYGLGLDVPYAQEVASREQCEPLMFLGLMPVFEVERQFKRIRSVVSTALGDVFTYFHHPSGKIKIFYCWRGIVMIAIIEQIIFRKVLLRTFYYKLTSSLFVLS